MPHRAGQFGLALALFAAPSAWGRPTFEQVNAWLEREFDASVRFPALSDVLFEYTVEQHHHVDPAELEALRRDAASVLDNAKSLQLRLLERKAAGPSIETRRAWIVDATTWRVNSDFVDHPVLRFSDLVLTKSIAWSSTHGELVLMDPRRGFPPDRDMSQAAFLIQEPINRLLFGGIDRIPQGRAEPGLSRINGPELVLEIPPSARMPGHRAVVRAKWDKDAERGFVNEVLIHPVDAGGEGPTARIIPSGWRYRPELSAWAAESVEMYRADGLLDRVVHLDAASRLERRDIERILRPPEDGRDETRGEIAWTTKRDFRRDPTLAKVEVAGVPLADSDASGRFRGAAWLIRGALLAAAGALFVAVILLRLRQRHRQPS